MGPISVKNFDFWGSKAISTVLKGKWGQITGVAWISGCRGP